MAKAKFALGLVWLLGLLALALPATPVTAIPDEVKWSRVNIPTEGKAGNWVLADGADIGQLTMAVDGTLYCYANPSGTNFTLFKSTDGGCSWSYTGEVEDEIAGIAIAPDNPEIIYYATSSDIHRSTDAGASFAVLVRNPGGAGSNNVEIAAIDVTSTDTGNIIAIGTRDTDSSQYGGIYILDESEPFTLVDSNLGNYDVCDVAFSPGFATDRQLVAVVTDETDTVVTARIGNDGWGEIIGDAIIGGLASVSADVAFPGDYVGEVTAGQYVQFVAIDTGTGNGDVYKIEGSAAPASSTVTDLNIGSNYGLDNVDIAGLAVTGNAAEAILLAGAAGQAQVYLSTDGGVNWTRNIKQPTGESETHVLMAPDFTSSGIAYAATSGVESAFSISKDSGIIWNQIGLIDTEISDIVDLAVSPDYSQDNTLFMVTFGGEHSLWRSLNGGTTWERLYSSALGYVDQIDLVELSPEYDGSQVVFLAGSSNGSPAIWKSTNNGQSFLRLTSVDPDTGVPLSIDTWAVVSDNTLFVGSFDGSNGVVCRKADSGLFYATRATAGSQPLNSMALSPSYSRDETIMVGNTDGWVYWSDDDGVSFEPLPPDATSPPLTDSITVAFDPDYSRNNTVYAASTTPDKGIYRFIIDKSTEWESIDGTLPDGGILTQLAVSDDGVLYAANSQQVDMAKKEGGIERCLNPTYSLGPAFETVTRGLNDGAALTGLWIRDNQLWSIDSADARLLTYTDSLTLPVTLTSPSDKATGTDTSNIKLKWMTSKGATSYRWQLDYDTDFSSLPAGFEGDTKATSVRLPALEPSTTYYWRVRAAEPVLSPWSAKWSFTTSLGAEAVAIKLYSPEAGAGGVPLRPLFQWSAVAGAESYELLVSADVSFANPLIVKSGAYALPSTAWQCDVNLDYDTTYYWRVRAINSDTAGAWGAAGVFTTESPPEPLVSAASSPSPPRSEPSLLPSPLPLPSPPPSPQQATPEWAKWLVYLGGVLLLVMLAVLITVIIVAVRVFRL